MQFSALNILSSSGCVFNRVFLKLSFYFSHNPSELEGAHQPKNTQFDRYKKNLSEDYEVHVLAWLKPEKKEDDLHSTDDGEASEESHGAPNETQLGHRLDLLVSLDVVKGGGVEVDLHQLEG